MSMAKNLTHFIYELETEVNTLRTFIDILRKEQQALIEGKIEEIDFFASDKSRLIDELIQLDDQRTQYLKKQGLIIEKNNINNWLIGQSSNQPIIGKLWNDLLELAEIAQKLNQANGLIISSRLQHNQRAYAALQSAAGNVSYYGPKGQAYV